MNGPTEQQLDAAWSTFVGNNAGGMDPRWVTAIMEDFYRSTTVTYQAMETVTCVH